MALCTTRASLTLWKCSPRGTRRRASWAPRSFLMNRGKRRNHRRVTVTGSSLPRVCWEWPGFSSSAWEQWKLKPYHTDDIHGLHYPFNRLSQEMGVSFQDFSRSWRQSGCNQGQAAIKGLWVRDAIVVFLMILVVLRLWVWDYVHFPQLMHPALCSLSL